MFGRYAEGVLMNIIPDLHYTPDEYKVASSIEGLYRSVLEQYDPRLITVYGIYPGYLSQRTKVLFVGREARGMSGGNYIEGVFNAYRNGCLNGKKQVSINRAAFHRRMLKVSYLLQNQLDAGQWIPPARTVGRTFGGPGGVSFAFMNSSHYSNESQNRQTNWVNLRASNRGTFASNFIEIVAPDLIIGMGMRNQLSQQIEMGPVIARSGMATLLSCRVGSHSCVLLDGYHYSAIKRDEDHYFAPARLYL
ncbi:MAG: hypothetical protein EA401_02655, partial [Planctomycetota bacterium]